MDKHEVKRLFCGRQEYQKLNISLLFFAQGDNILDLLNHRSQAQCPGWTSESIGPYLGPSLFLCLFVFFVFLAECGALLLSKKVFAFWVCRTWRCQKRFMPKSCIICCYSCPEPWNMFSTASPSPGNTQHQRTVTILAQQSLGMRIPVPGLQLMTCKLKSAIESAGPWIMV